MRGKGTERGKGTKLGSRKIRDYYVWDFRVFHIRDFYIWDCFIREKFVAPSLAVFGWTNKWNPTDISSTSNNNVQTTP